MIGQAESTNPDPVIALELLDCLGGNDRLLKAKEEFYIYGFSLKIHFSLSSRGDDYEDELKRYQNYKDGNPSRSFTQQTNYRTSRRSPSPTKAGRTPPQGSNKRYKPPLQGVSPPRDGSSYNSDHHSNDLRDSLNWGKDGGRGRYRYLGSGSGIGGVGVGGDDYRRTSNTHDTFHGDKRTTDFRELVSPASSSDEKELNNHSRKTSVKNISSGATDSGLSEDHGSTGSNASSSGHHSDDLSTLPRSLHHQKVLSIKIDATNKIRRPSSDSTRSLGYHNDLDSVRQI